MNACRNDLLKRFPVSCRKAAFAVQGGPVHIQRDTPHSSALQFFSLSCGLFLCHCGDYAFHLFRFSRYVILLISKYFCSLLHLLDDAYRKRTVPLTAAAGDTFRSVMLQCLVMVRDRFRNLSLRQRQIQIFVHIRYIDTDRARRTMPAVHTITL